MLPKNYHKRSFLRFDCALESARLLDEFQAIKNDSWASSYWGSIHCSIGMLLLRGGDKGTEFDFFSEQVSDKPILDKLPYIKHLISKEGPFGKATYAFIFKLQPNGVTLKHQDTIETWFDMYRIHVPIITNSGAHLIVNEKSQHLDSEHAWSFDNQAEHGVVNGNKERVHLIFDVPFSDKVANQIDRADQLEGQKIDEHIDRISQTSKAVASYPGDEVIKGGILALQQQGATCAQIAQMLNAKKIPSKTYPISLWNEEMVADLT